MDLVVSEVFGPTVQGEGPSLGRRCAFIRLGLCNLTCSWCDTPYTWDWQGRNGVAYDRHAELSKRTTFDLAEQVDALDVPLVVLSGGEPLVQRAPLGVLASLLRARGMEVEVETNGTLEPSAMLVDAVSRWNVSPKLAHSGVDFSKRIRLDVLCGFAGTGRAAFKFVVQQLSDLDELADLVAAAGLPASAVYVMPEGVDAGTVGERLTVLADDVIARGWNLTTRLHVAVWGQRRGV